MIEIQQIHLLEVVLEAWLMACPQELGKKIVSFKNY